MSKSLLALNGLLAVAALFFATEIWRSLVAPYPAARARARPTTASAAPPRAAVEAPAEPRPPLTSYAVVGTKSLFSPGRTEGAAAAGPGGVGPRPFLYGVVLRDDLSIAYLEDPGSKRVSGYRIGDAIAGGTLAAIAADHVVLKRVDGMVDVQLRDPTKPRVVAPEAAAAPGTPQPGMVPGLPGTLPQLPTPPGVAPGTFPQPLSPPGVPGVFPRSPALLRRLPVPQVPSTPPVNPNAPDQ